MDAPLWLQLLALFLLIVANGFFALSEFSIIASRRGRLRQKSVQRKRGAAAAERLHANPEKFLATIQVGITLVGTVAGVFGGATLVERLRSYLESSPYPFLVGSAHGVAVVVVAIGITVTTVVLGELVPKYVALSHPERFARYVSLPTTVFIKLTSVFSSILSATAAMIVRLLGVKKESGRPLIGEEEINQMIFEGKERGIIDATEEQLIRSVFEFADTSVRRAMTPRTAVVGIDINASPEKIVFLIIEEGYSRYPVYEGDLDNIVGILYTKDIIVQEMNPELIILKDMIRKPAFVPDSMPLSALLREFQRRKYHMAIVLDEFGGTAGIITLEDILEELVGEIQDEYDTEQMPLVKHSETVAYADGSVRPGDVNRLMESHLPEDTADTLAGLVIHHLGRLPERYEQIDIADMRIVILEHEANRLTRLKLEKTGGAPVPGGD
jgi:putative hemolysin